MALFFRQIISLSLAIDRERSTDSENLAFQITFKVRSGVSSLLHSSLNERRAFSLSYVIKRERRQLLSDFYLFSIISSATSDKMSAKMKQIYRLPDEISINFVKNKSKF